MVILTGMNQPGNYGQHPAPLLDGPGFPAAGMSKKRSIGQLAAASS
jgi:hypothetical protein